MPNLLGNKSSLDDENTRTIKFCVKYVITSREYV